MTVHYPEGNLVKVSVLLPDGNLALCLHRLLKAQESQYHEVPDLRSPTKSIRFQWCAYPPHEALAKLFGIQPAKQLAKHIMRMNAMTIRKETLEPSKLCIPKYLDGDPFFCSADYR